MFAYTCTYVSYVYIHTCISLEITIDLPIGFPIKHYLSTCICICIHIYIGVYTCVYIYAYTCMQTCIYLHIYQYMNVYMHIQKVPGEVMEVEGEGGRSLDRRDPSKFASSKSLCSDSSLSAVHMYEWRTIQAGIELWTWRTHVPSCVFVCRSLCYASSFSVADIWVTPYTYQSQTICTTQEGCTQVILKWLTLLSLVNFWCMLVIYCIVLPFFFLSHSLAHT